MSEQSKEQRDRERERGHAKEAFQKFAHIAIVCAGFAALMVAHVVIKVVTSTPAEFSMAGDLAFPLVLAAGAAIAAGIVYVRYAKPARTEMKRLDDASVTDTS